LLVLASLVGVVVSIAAWAFLELVYYIQQWVFTDIPEELGFDSTPLWWYLPVLAIAGLVPRSRSTASLAREGTSRRRA
jgi:H+/Cl- antiporter ClcA